MIVQREFLNKLKDFGLNSYEAKLWTALLSRGVATAGELSDIANVPRSRSYDVLESLERKGFVVMKIGKPIKYFAVKPEEVIERVKKRIKDDAVKETVMIDKLKSSDILTELNILHNQSFTLVEPSDLTGVVKGREALYTHLNSMIKTAKKSIQLSATGEGILRKGQALRNALRKAKSRGVKIQILAPAPKKKNEATNFLNQVAQIKHIPEPIGRFCIIDNEQVALMVLDDKSIHPTSDFCIWISTKFFTQTFSNLFDLFWSKARK